MDKLIVIAGATASSKTATAVSIAKKVNGEIINCDSMQIYQKMDIATAKVTIAEMDGIPHHMIDIIDYDKHYTVADYSATVKHIISDIIERGKQPILCGGTGLYIDSIIYPFNFGTTDTDNANLRQELLLKLDNVGAITLHNELAKLDPDDAKKIHPNNTKRLIRALEIYYSTGKTKSELSNKSLQYDLDFIALEWDRQQLYDRINKRVDAMFDLGIVQEVSTLAPNKECFNYQSMQAIGYKEFQYYLFGDGTTDIDNVATSIKQNSRHYAKRQITWLKKYDFARWLTPEQAIQHYNKG